MSPTAVLSDPVCAPGRAADADLALYVQGKTEIADGVVELTLASEHELPAWAAGAHVDLVLSPEVVRQYSLCGDPADRHSYRVAVLRDANSRGGSAYLHERLGAGDTITV